jgi:hypothetical protein
MEAPCDHHGCEKLSTTVCGRCKKVHYCGRAHQIASWKAHKQSCVAKSAQVTEEQEDLSGVCVIDVGPPLGRVCTATRAFEAGDVVLVEKPALVWPT